MKKRSLWILGAVALFFGAVALAVYVATTSFETTLEFRVVDSVSGGWVWNSTIRLQDRLMRVYYQTDQGAVDLVFRGLTPGRAELSVEAPSYEPQRLPVRLRRGRNVLPEPVRMVGLEIPYLSHFIVVPSLEESELRLEVRPVGGDGRAVLNHPSLDIWIGALVSAQLMDGRYTTRQELVGSTRGETLFAGKVQWTWDGTPETSLRYRASIPLSEMQPSPASFWVIDTFIAVPRPGAINREEMEQIMLRVYELEEFDDIQGYLDQFGDRLDYYLPPTSWNVRGGSA